MPKITVLCNRQSPDGPVIEEIAKVLKVDPSSLSVDRNPAPMGYVTVSVKPIRNDERQKLLAIGQVNQIT